MASQLYTNYLNLMLGDDSAAHSLPDLDTDTIKCALVNGTDDYTFSAAHQDKGDVTSYGASTDQTLSNITITAGVVDNTADLTFTSVVLDVSDVDILVHYQDSGTPGTSPLICYHDAFTPVTPNGGNITVAYNASGIFAL